jgi:hypothetical protein
MTTSARIFYVIMATLLILIGWLHLATLVLTAFFGCFALNLLSSPGARRLGNPRYSRLGSLRYGESAVPCPEFHGSVIHLSVGR